MEKKKSLILIITTIVILIISLAIPRIKKFIENEKIKNASIIVELNGDLSVPFNTEKRVSDFIQNINGKIVDDYKINTTKLGEKTIKFEYINDENIKIPYSFKIDVVDMTAPIVWLGSSYSITTKFEGNLTEKIMCVDDIDDAPDCKIEGDYDTTKSGSYELKYIATDDSGNEKVWPFTLYVNEPSKGNGSSSKPSRTKFEDAIKNYKNEKTKVGIDVSSWQGDINFEKVKSAGVEFVIIRVGSKWGMDGDYFIDSKFEQNIEGFNKVGLPVGIYFYSYAKNSKEAYEEAMWIIDKIKKYKIDLPIAFDWENWSSFNKYNLSMYSLTEMSKVFLNTIEKHGYRGMNYSSKSYLEGIWFDTGYPTWLAHYTKQTNYEGDYMFWQFCNNGLVDGINGNVDLNVMYLK